MWEVTLEIPESRCQEPLEYFYQIECSLNPNGSRQQERFATHNEYKYGLLKVPTRLNRWLKLSGESLGYEDLMFW